MKPERPFEFEVCVVGTGRVGLPLALSLAEQGTSVVGVDTDAALRTLIARGEMPWFERGYDALIKSPGLRVDATPEVVSQSRIIIITVGTPLHPHLEADLRQIRAVLGSIAPHLRPGHGVVLRSTLAPGTTKWALRWLTRETGMVPGEDFHLVYAPERIAEGKAYAELRTLPQIIGAEHDASWAMAEGLFSRLAPECLRADFTHAELAKLFTNITRYVSFAVANQFAVIADSLNANVYTVRELANKNYPRQQVPAPGLTAGTCLRKDFGMVSERLPYPDLFLSAWKVNEGMPRFLVQRALAMTTLDGARVALLGYAFKANTDDIRDSLSAKLYRAIEREFPESIKIADPWLGPVIDDSINGALTNFGLGEALSDADCVFVAVAHSGFKEALQRLAIQRPECWVVDLWNVGGRDENVYRAGDL